jgi:hypothetical protein
MQPAAQAAPRALAPIGWPGAAREFNAHQHAKVAASGKWCFERHASTVEAGQF